MPARPAPQSHVQTVQRLANGTAIQMPPNLAHLPQQGGQPLPPAVRQKVESLFRASFADVRVHIGPQAATIGALAFTRGSDIHFAPGHYDPATHRGRQILGHELAHVQQQKTNRVRNPFGSGVALVHDALMEAEAERMGTRVAMAFTPADLHPIQRKQAGRRIRPGVIQRHPNMKVQISDDVAFLQESLKGRSLSEGKTAAKVGKSSKVVIDKGDVWESRLHPDLKTSSSFNYQWFRVVSLDGANLEDRDIYIPGGTFTEIEQLTEAPKLSKGVFKGPIRTFGGVWTAQLYDVNPGVKDITARGAKMELIFTPAYPADATVIVLVQSVKAIKNEMPYFLEDDKVSYAKEQSEVIKARSGQGFSIDHKAWSQSFAYASVPSSLIDLENGAGTHGCRFQGKNGWNVQPATLNDYPHIRGVKSTSGQYFETTALAIEGNDAGTYYGSVRWGWEAKNGSPDIELMPFEVGSYGSATPHFQKSVTLWNKTKTIEEEEPFPLPNVPRLEIK
jgi:hypothetical protein